MRKSFAAVAALAAAFSFAQPASANSVVRCVQRALIDYGYDPRGIDGSIGPGTLGAAATYRLDYGADLPDLTPESAALWCREISVTPLPEPEAGADSFCQGFEEEVRGYWLDPAGRPAIGFRLASDEAGAGCYTWLNAFPGWSRGAGAQALAEVARIGDMRAWYSGRGGDGVFLDSGTALARFVRGGRATYGIVTEVWDAAAEDEAVNDVMGPPLPAEEVPAPTE